MRIAIVGIRFDNRGGSERRAMHLTKGLIHKGHDVEVFADSVNDTEGLGVTVHKVGSSGLGSYHRIKSFTRNVNRMLSGRADIDIVHNQIRPFVRGVVSVGGGCHASYLERRKSASGFLKSLSLDINPFHRYVLDLERRMYSEDGCPAVITNSHMAKEDILKHYAYPAGRIHVAYNGVDSAKFSPADDPDERKAFRDGLGIGDGEIAVLFVGSDFGRKGLDVLIESMRGLDGYRLVVVGRGDEAGYGKLAEQSGLKPPVFAGTVPDALGYYRAADIYALPTMYDPFANTTLEAMACGLPVITTTDNGVSEIITNGRDGYVIFGGDRAEAVHSALGILGSGKLREEIGSSARECVSSLTWDKTLDTVLGIYDTVLGQGGGKT